MAGLREIMTRPDSVRGEMLAALTTPATNTVVRLFAQLDGGHIDVLELFPDNVVRDSIFAMALDNHQRAHVDQARFEELTNLMVEAIVEMAQDPAHAPQLAAQAAMRPPAQQARWNQFLLAAALRHANRTVIPLMLSAGAFSPATIVEADIVSILVPGRMTFADAFANWGKPNGFQARQDLETEYGRITGQPIRTLARLGNDAAQIDTEVTAALPTLPDTATRAETDPLSRRMIGGALAGIHEHHGIELCRQMIHAIDPAHPSLTTPHATFADALADLLLARIQPRAQVAIRRADLEEEIRERAMETMHELQRELRGSALSQVFGRGWLYGRHEIHDPPPERRERAFSAAAGRLFADATTGALHMTVGNRMIAERELQQLLGVAAGRTEGEMARRMESAWGMHRYAHWIKSRERYTPSHQPEGITSQTVAEGIGQGILGRLRTEFPAAAWSAEARRDEMAARITELFLNAQAEAIAGTVEQHPGLVERVTNFIRSHRTARGIIGIVGLASIPVMPLEGMLIGALVGWPALIDAWKNLSGPVRSRSERALHDARLEDLTPLLAAHTAMSTMETMRSGVGRHTDKRELPHTIEGITTGGAVRNAAALDLRAERLGNALFSPTGNELDEPRWKFTHWLRQRNGRAVLQAYAGRLREQIRAMLIQGTTPDAVNTFLVTRLQAFFAAWEAAQDARRRTNGVKWFLPYGIANALKATGQRTLRGAGTAREKTGTFARRKAAELGAAAKGRVRRLFRRN